MSRRLLARIVVCVGLFLSFLLTPLVGLAQEAEFVPPSHEYLNQVVWIGALEGSWKEMGIQYGQRAAKDIRNNSDTEWKGTLEHFDNDPQRVIRLAKAYEEQIYLLSPEMIDFMEGIAEGAAEELNKSVYVDQASNYMRILAQQLEMALRPRYEQFLDGQSTGSLGTEEESDTHACQGWWVTGPATKDGETYVTRHSQGGSWGSENANGVAFVLVPEDPCAAVTFVQCAAGDIGGSGQCFNEYGVYQGWTVANTRKPVNEWAAIGVPEYVYNLPAVVFSKSAQEAVDYVKYGTPRYRRLTGRTTLLRARSAVLMYSDEKEAFVIEKVARRLAVRTPGSLGETGNSYLCMANHFLSTDGSYDENDVFSADIPMAEFVPEQEGNSSYYRMWGMMWWFKNHYGEITLDMLMNDLSASHYAYDREGNYIAPNPDTGLPEIGAHCVHGSFTEDYPLGTKASWNVSIAVPGALQIYFIPAMPCQWVQHSWNCVDLNIYSAYRKAVYGTD